VQQEVRAVPHTASNKQLASRSSYLQIHPGGSGWSLEHLILRIFLKLWNDTWDNGSNSRAQWSSG
jgi:hypothetical protein